MFFTLICVTNFLSRFQGMMFTIISVIGTMIIGMFIGRKILNVNRDTSYLISSGTAICGGSAIAAVGPVIKAKDSDMSVALATIFVLNAIALFIFPVMGGWLGLTQQEFGTWAAIAIHDTSSVVGAGAAYGYSLASLFRMSEFLLLGQIHEGMHVLHELYFESAAMILVLITVGKMLESRSKGKTTSALRALMDLAPKTATVLRDGKERGDQLLLAVIAGGSTGLGLAQNDGRLTAVHIGIGGNNGQHQFLIQELDGDEMLPAAVDVILETGQASVSMLQRRLKLGYSRAARIVDQMEEIGVVGPFEGSKPRQLLITKDQWLQMQGLAPENPIEENPTSGKENAENQDAEKPPQLNTNSSITKKNKDIKELKEEGFNCYYFLLSVSCSGHREWQRFRRILHDYGQTIR